jgi:predicted CoA-binding protein
LLLHIVRKKTLVVGASPKPSRYSYEAVVRLKHHGHPVYAYGLREADIMGTPIQTEWPAEKFDTITLYLNPYWQQDYYERIIKLWPKRVIFNPGTENPRFVDRLEKAGIEVEEACTLVMLSIGNY